MRVKAWFENKIREELALGGSRPYIISISEAGRETEKAVLASVEYGFSSSLEKTTTVWIPKSCLMSEEEAEQEDEKVQKVFTSGLQYNEKLVAFAKENGLKVRTGMKTVTLISKIREAGLEVPARA